jgi:hypothetical protein
MLLVLALECQRQIEHRLLQQAAVRSDLVGRDRFQFGAKRGVEDAHIGGGGLAAFRQSLLPGEQRDGRAREQQTGFAEEGAARFERVGGVA